ncbi:hypothetical protein NAT51_02860 [Flavobacterium amniphilum]|uniref:hypothetical protein n=1 Tax=Flavobacterium amniphilum TaxID=1834035 RepID=UPI002029CB69|nr:hypothetical protein [Flavobacterium amniphilum]MCL9804445.1 hypothetical protein [Flavobacterium amniphilum]
MTIKKSIIRLLFILLLVSCQNKSENVYVKLLNSELDDSKVFLTENLTQIGSAIEFKVGDYPFLKPSYDSLKIANDKIDHMIAHPVKTKDKDTLNKLKTDLENKYKLALTFKGLSLENSLDEELYFKIVELDLLKAKYKLNESYFTKHCNIVE